MRALLVAPLTWALVGLAIALWRNRPARYSPMHGRTAPRWAYRLGWIVLLLLWLSSTPKAARLLEARLVNGPPPPIWAGSETPQAILVFAGGLDGSSANAPPSASSRERLLTALQAARRWPAAAVVFSGASQLKEGPSSAERMLQLAVELGLEPGRAVLESAARDTHQNAERAVDLMQERGWKRVAVVTSATHMLRSVRALQKLGVDPWPVPCPAIEASRRWLGDTLPHAESLVASTAALHEWVGLAYYRIKGWI